MQRNWTNLDFKLKWKTAMWITKIRSLKRFSRKVAEISHYKISLFSSCHKRNGSEKLRKIFRKDILWRHIWWASALARRAVITNFRTANMVFCAAFNCRNSSKSGVSFFPFPLKDEKCCKEWFTLMKRKDFTPTAASKLCSDYFSPQCFEQDLAFKGNTWNFHDSRHSRPVGFVTQFPQMHLHVI